MYTYIHHTYIHTYKSSSSLRDQARLSRLASPHSGSWFREIPNPKLGLSMNREEFVTASRVWLGLSLLPSPPNAVQCICDLVLDKFGDHLLGCGRRALRTKRQLFERNSIPPPLRRHIGVASPFELLGAS